MACVTWRQRRSLWLATPCAISPIWATSAPELRERARSSRRAMMVPVMSASAALTQCAPTSIPTTHPDSGLSS